ncbi:glycoside hydrolase [Lasiosphaeria miniovina]|uniref:Mannan endo-1,6-alpha-mannosidase n=1 Tax=Lasiosphaeria miniovina TaxID=1954250 RepID=A0AA39ZQM3_9PEZI|nr:glycoside hydrolase [Lasiosphaeria miniovina]KAK0701813.1 glycoside hydrolase [Lasiosphaeria miniovina]
MKFFKSINNAAAVAAVITAAPPKELNINQPSSIQSVAKTIAAGAMSYYPGTTKSFADLPKPYYWWECGALMGAMLDYSHYTGDKSYDETIATALLAQVGPEFNYMLPAHFGDEGNDDLGFWGFAVMSAAERNFPQPDPSIPPWLDLGANIWNSLASRWNTTACSGGLLWQIFASNPNGLDYKNTVSNGGFFQLSARLARATGNDTYLEWANKVWDWTQGVGMIDDSYHVFDGASSSDNCTKINPVSFSYSASIFMYGAAVLANYTNDTKWVDRTTGLLEGSKWFFSPFENATNIMFEHACEQVDKCNTDMRSFKGYFSRFVYASTLYVPSILPTVNELLHTSAAAAAQSCTGGANGTTCGHKWYVGGFDGSVGLGEEMCALETIQGLLVAESTPPLKGDEIKVVRAFSGAASSSAPTSTSSTTSTAAATAAPSSTQSSSAVKRSRRRSR